MIKKILFETLQRFDLKDANELQQGVLDKLEGLANGLNWQLSQAIPAGGPLSRITCVGVSGGIARFSPMVLLTAEHDVLVFDSDDQDDARLQCDLSATYATWLDTDRTGAIYFYAYPKYEEGDTENREFFSLIDNAPSTRAINTRAHLNIEFFANLDASYNIANAEGYLPIRIGYVDADDFNTIPKTQTQVSEETREQVVVDNGGNPHASQNTNSTTNETTNESCDIYPSGSVTDFSNVPYQFHNFATINDVGKRWIMKYYLALCKELLGSIRAKYQSIPIPGGET